MPDECEKSIVLEVGRESATTTTAHARGRGRKGQSRKMGCREKQGHSEDLFREFDFHLTNCRRETQKPRIGGTERGLEDSVEVRRDSNATPARHAATCATTCATECAGRSRDAMNNHSENVPESRHESKRKRKDRPEVGLFIGVRAAGSFLPLGR